MNVSWDGGGHAFVLDTTVPREAGARDGGTLVPPSPCLQVTPKHCAMAHMMAS